MPIYLEISQLHRCVTIVARGKIAPEEIMSAALQIIEARVPEFAKLVDVTAASAEMDAAWMERIAALLRGVPGVKRGPVAFLIDRGRGEFARAFKATQEDRPVEVFTSLREARRWLEQIAEAERRLAAGGSWETTPWTDPSRQAVMFRHGQRRTVPIRQGGPASEAA